MRVLLACMVVLALGVAAPQALAANSLSISAPATAEENGVFAVHVSGNTDELSSSVTHIVQKADCPSTGAAAQQNGGTSQNPRQFFESGPFSYDTTLTTQPDPSKPSLTGLTKVCG